MKNTPDITQCEFQVKRIDNSPTNPSSPAELIQSLVETADAFINSRVNAEGTGRVESLQPVFVRVVFQGSAVHPCKGNPAVEAGETFECSGPLLNISPSEGYLTVSELTIPFPSIQSIRII